ncbi:hypothetical protein VUR80DRAFT_378 [Thermomyces stellatus]
MLFAAATYAPLNLLRRSGYSTPRLWRQAAFYKVRTLYSLDVEKDMMVVLQAVLLMSFWRGNSREDKGTWHWSGLATSAASTASLHSQSGVRLSKEQRTLRGRCWWSCVLRDRLLALSEERALRIRLDEYDVLPLTLADYNVGLRCATSELTPDEEPGKRTALSMFSLQLMRLVSLIGKRDPRRPGYLNSSSPPAMKI